MSIKHQCCIRVLILFFLQTVFRIWDCLFYEGSKILFRVGLTLVSLNQETLLQCDDLASLIMCFKAITHDALVTDCHSFMQVIAKLFVFKMDSTTSFFLVQNIFKVPGSLKNSTIARLRQECADKAAAARKKWFPHHYSICIYHRHIVITSHLKAILLPCAISVTMPFFSHNTIQHTAFYVQLNIIILYFNIWLWRFLIYTNLTICIFLLRWFYPICGLV